MKQGIPRTIWGPFLLFLAGCAFLTQYGQLERSARTAYAGGQYDEAVVLAAQSLRIKPDYEKAQVLLQDAFLMVSRTRQRDIKSLWESTDPFRFDDLVREFEALQRANDIVAELPPLRTKKTGALIRIDTEDFRADLEGLRDSAATAHYVRGLELAELDGIDHQKQAAKEFKESLYYVPDFQDAESRYESSRQAGIKRIAIIPFEDLSGKGTRYGAISASLVDDIVSAILRDPSATEFLEIVSRDQLDRVIAEQKLALSGLLDESTVVEVGKILGVHEFVTGKITQVIYAPVRTVDKTYDEQARIVIRTEKYKDSEGKTKKKKIYGDVKARVMKYTRTTSASIRGSYNIVDAETARLVRSETFQGDAKYEYAWAEYQGDSRALSYRSARLVKAGEQVAPVSTEMVARAEQDLADQLATTLKAYAR